MNAPGCKVVQAGSLPPTAELTDPLKFMDQLGAAGITAEYVRARLADALNMSYADFDSAINNGLIDLETAMHVPTGTLYIEVNDATTLPAGKSYWKLVCNDAAAEATSSAYVKAGSSFGAKTIIVGGLLILGAVVLFGKLGKRRK